MPSVEKRKWRGSKAEKFIPHSFPELRCGSVQRCETFVIREKIKTHQKHEEGTQSFNYIWILGTAVRFI